MQIYVVARFRKVLSDPSLQSSPFAQGVIRPGWRALAERLIAAHPNPTEEEIRESAAVLEPFLRNTRIVPQSPSFKVGVIVATLLPGLVLGLLSGLLFRGGLVLRLLGIAVVTSSGSEVSRLRALWRSVIAWSPCAAVIVITPLLLLLSPSLIVPATGMLLAVSLFGIVAAAVTPARGLQDRLAGTYLVPR
jgi:eukaryotic-like serine/threonine-protein kinase